MKSFQLGINPFQSLNSITAWDRGYFFHICTLLGIPEFWAEKYFQKVQYLRRQQNIGWNEFILTSHYLTNHILPPQAPDMFNPKVSLQTCGIIQKLYKTKHNINMAQYRWPQAFFNFGIYISQFSQKPTTLQAYSPSCLFQDTMHHFGTLCNIVTKPIWL